MAQNTRIDCPAGQWTLLTNSNVTAITFQLAPNAKNAVLIAGTAGATPPANNETGIWYYPGEGEYSLALADAFPGVAANRVYVYALSTTYVMVSHA